MAIERTEAVRQVIEAGHRLCREGLAARTWGNISARISDTQFVITPSGRAYDTLTPADIVTVNISDCSYEGSVKPSSEKGIHAACYALRDNVDFVVHTHQPMATAVGALGLDMPVSDPLLGSSVPCAAYAISSTKALKKKVADCVARHPGAAAFFMRCHGVLCLGGSCGEAFDIAARLEDICRAEVEDSLRLDGNALAGYIIPQALRELVPEPCLYFANTPAIMAAGERAGLHRPVIDDMAQIGGADFFSVELKFGWELDAARLLRGRNAILLSGLGAVCTGRNEDEARAVATVLEKNCLAALFAGSRGKRPHLSYPDALLQRAVYLTKYSKLKK